jgi:hypothetical protein
LLCFALAAASYNEYEMKLDLTHHFESKGVVYSVIRDAKEAEEALDFYFKHFLQGK